MMRVHHLLRVPSVSATLLAAALLVCSGCDRSESSTQTTQCARFCEALEKCDDETDLADCQDHCQEDEVHSAAYFRARADCGARLSCNLWATEVDRQGDALCETECDLNDCVDNAMADIEPTDAQEEVCSSIGTKVNACDPSLEVDKTERACLRTTPVLSDQYLADSERCVDSQCGDINQCLDDLADEYSTDLKLFSESIAPR
jgi:hypothetical protein